jgi:hypothetical protein
MGTSDLVEHVYMYIAPHPTNSHLLLAEYRVELTDGVQHIHKMAVPVEVFTEDPKRTTETMDMCALDYFVTELTRLYG